MVGRFGLAVGAGVKRKAETEQVAECSRTRNVAPPSAGRKRGTCFFPRIPLVTSAPAAKWNGRGRKGEWGRPEAREMKWRVRWSRWLQECYSMLTPLASTMETIWKRGHRRRGVGELRGGIPAHSEP